MEFPEEIVALIRQFAKPCFTKEALVEYNKAIKIYGAWPRLKRAMVTPKAVQIVRDYNQETDLIEELHLLYGETPLNTTRSAHIRLMLRERGEVRRSRGRAIRVLLAGESIVAAMEERGEIVY
jgi:hypothetical protein